MKVLLAIIIILILLVIGIYCNTLFRGRSLIWNQILRELKISGNAQVAILGLNYAGLFIDVAKRLKAPGKVTGVNTGNENVTKQENERIKENRVADRAKLVDGSLLNLSLESRTMTMSFQHLLSIVFLPRLIGDGQFRKLFG